MSDCMHFPDTVEEFMEQYKITDTEQVYSNGTEYVPIFRMKQWFEHEAVKTLLDVQSERLTDDDFETIRIHLNAYKEALCNQHRWKEAEEYQRIIDRFMGFASQPTIKPRKGKWIYSREYGTAKVWTCSECGWNDIGEWNFCPNCGADMRGEEE